MNRDALNWLVLLIIIAIAGGGLYYRYQDIRPCTHPLSYAIGAVDKRFGTSNSALLATAKEAAAIWNKAAGKTVLSYDPSAALKINLVYDERQANAKFGNDIARQQVNAYAARATLDAMQAQYAARQTAYNQEVAAVNARGGATPREAAALNAERESLNALAASVNSQVALFNKGVADLNAAVEQFNQTAGQTFREGEYVQDASGKRINIFEFIGATQLERVLAHEFGHAIGLDHNSDPKAIMFAKNESGNLVPTKADITDLKALCGA